MGRRGVHQTGAGFGGDVGAADDGDITVLKRVLEQHLVELVASAGTSHRAFQAIALERRIQRVRGPGIRAPFSVSIRS